ncbi:MAG: four helix bundle protein [Candidatus Marinimicrobia bacterium]|jgi:four helix bundle protein|nr:four helix bundle protein [Candidatus Neomarinimicrobiota bacterium]MBT3495988.1 four helix bundle protein [Candidatus Neomarinimicrobiota bacterium]MBT3732706.1 four helix bundle protein [Candidatus Neomarinimicrobiota bacterium]MBT4178031.1 four helix bundle protein [Candidatus Neomarinimicrobiota bacterium]MBT4592618.1 four helix bundle protein [Candidatus Neomarinimicrobiota bacterium]
MKENIVKDKSLDFAVRIVKLYQYLSFVKNEYVMSKQVLKSGTAIGALVRESEHAESKADFIHKLAIAQKESNETLYWLELLMLTQYLEKSEYESINQDGTEIIKLLTKIIITTRKNL